MSELIQIQEKFELDEQVDPVEMENKSDAEVIKYWKHREVDELAVPVILAGSGHSSEEKPK